MNKVQQKSVQLTHDEKHMVHIMQLLGDSTRFKMFKLLTERQELCVSEIADSLGVSLSAVSQHFRQFELAGLVHKQRMGQKICYLLEDDNPIVHELTDTIKLSSN